MTSGGAVVGGRAWRGAAAAVRHLRYPWGRAELGSPCSCLLGARCCVQISVYFPQILKRGQPHLRRTGRKSQRQNDEGRVSLVVLSINHPDMPVTTGETNAEPSTAACAVPGSKRRLP
jgi:hypothetical protein